MKTQNKLLEENFEIKQTLWTPMQISDCLRETGFKILECCKHLQPGIPATNTDWKIMYIAKNSPAKSC